MSEDRKSSAVSSPNETDAKQAESVPDKKKMISMAMKVENGVANEFRRMAKESGMEQGMFLHAMLDNFRLNEDKTLYKEYAEDIQVMRDLTATINYRYVALIAQNKIAEEKAHAKDAKRIEELKRENEKLKEEKSQLEAVKQRNGELEHEVNELKEMLYRQETILDQLKTAHKNEIDSLTNRYNAQMTELAHSYAEKYMKFAEESVRKNTQ